MTKNKINILIVEDEALVALDLSLGLEKEGFSVVGIADNAEDAIDLFTSNPVDIILMDIHIIGCKDGVETAMEMLKIRQVPVIYLTAFTHSATVERAKLSYPAAFLAKPYNINNVHIALEIAISNYAQAKHQNNLVANQFKGPVRTEEEPSDKEIILQLDHVLFIKYNYRYVKLLLSDILYIEADNNNINLITTTKKFLLRLSLNQLLEKINDKNLFRIHRSYAVNIQAVTSFNDQSVFFDKVELPIGRIYKPQFLRNFR